MGPFCRAAPGYFWRAVKPGGQGAYWQDVYGITCDELWASGLNPADSGFYRIRLDSLGPPTPAVQ